MEFLELQRAQSSSLQIILTQKMSLYLRFKNTNQGSLGITKNQPHEIFMAQIHGSFKKTHQVSLGLAKNRPTHLFLVQK